MRPETEFAYLIIRGLIKKFPNFVYNLLQSKLLLKEYTFPSAVSTPESIFQSVYFGMFIRHFVASQGIAQYATPRKEVVPYGHMCQKHSLQNAFNSGNTTEKRRSLL